ncbi:MAG: hypothetical protein AAF402_13060 [Pseudomonadota bacterium]
MSTGSFENWTGNISEIGALYPFESTVPLLIVIMFCFWILFQIGLLMMERQRFSEDAKRNTAARLKRLIKREGQGG